VHIERAVYGLSAHVQPTVPMQRTPEDLVTLRVRGVVEILQRGQLAGSEPAVGQQGLESLTYVEMLGLQDVDRRVGEVAGRGHQTGVSAPRLRSG
jgi:hypothetical protein